MANKRQTYARPGMPKGFRFGFALTAGPVRKHGTMPSGPGLGSPTLQEVGRAIGRTRQHTCNIESIILRKLRKELGSLAESGDFDRDAEGAGKVFYNALTEAAEDANLSDELARRALALQRQTPGLSDEAAIAIASSQLFPE